MSDGHYADYQLGIYMNGLAGELPSLPLAYPELQEAARASLDPGAYGYVAGSAGAEITAADNVTAFDRWKLVPRHLRDVSTRDHAVEILGTRSPAPVWLAPVGVLGIIHEEAEIAVGRAAAALGLPMTLSTVSSRPLEAVAEAMGDGPRWFQLYWPGPDAVTRSLLERAESAGYSAVVVTLDTRFLAWRVRDLARAYLPFLKGEGLANYFTDPAFAQDLGASPADDPQAAILHWARGFADPSQTWDDLARLREMTSLPIVLKGVVHPDDGRLAIEQGVDGIVVSNHGGRQVDGSIAAIAALPAVAEAIDGRIPILFDSGIRGGADVVKALCLGAQAVLVARPWVWGLALEGEAGVRTVLQRLLADYDLTMALSGFCRPAELTPDVLIDSGR